METVTTLVESPLECELPELDNVAVGFDRDSVNAQFSAPGAADRTLGNLAPVWDWVPNAWRHDDAESPGRSIGGPETCDAAQGRPGAAVDILLGCPTVVLE